MQYLYQVLLVALTSTAGIQAAYERYSVLLDNVASRSAGYVNIYVSRVDQKAVVGVQLAWGVGGKTTIATVGSQTLNVPMSGNQVRKLSRYDLILRVCLCSILSLDQALVEVVNPVLGVTGLTGLKISVVLNDPANTTLQGTIALAQTVASV